MKQNKQFFRRLLAVAFWLAVWQTAAMAIGQEMWCWRYAPPGGAPPMRCWLR